MKAFVILLLTLVSTSSFGQKKWIILFNGKNLEGWNVKIAKHNYQQNFGNTFYVEDGLLKVKYDAYDNFDQQYGHLFYKKPFSYYLLRIEYRFVGNQAKGGEGWALRNSGVMLHSQAPSTMLKDQDFPISIEAQFLGGNGIDERPTGNVCTPGTTIEVKDKLFSPHCLNSTSKTYHGNQWVTAELLVLGDEEIKHIINGQTVLTYTKPKIGGGNISNFDPAIKEDGKALRSGYIALQSESHPIEFRTVKLIDLSAYKANRQKLFKIVEAHLQHKFHD